MIDIILYAIFAVLVLAAAASYVWLPRDNLKLRWYVLWRYRGDFGKYITEELKHSSHVRMPAGTFNVRTPITIPSRKWVERKTATRLKGDHD